MVKLVNNKRICACGKHIKNYTDVLCSSCLASYKHLQNNYRSELNSTIEDFIQYVKYECGYTNKKPKDIL